jgi:ribosome-binding protein aMBF1 (putative translation factor)
MAKDSEFRDWWQTIYEELLRRNKQKIIPPRVITSSLFLKIGREIKKARIRMGLSQTELAFCARIKQPDISKIEKGKKNITLKTLLALSKALNIKAIDTA